MCMLVSESSPIFMSSFQESPNIVVLRGAEIEPYLEEIVDLMLIVYKESPFFYEGTREEYLPLVKFYSDSKDGIACLMFDGKKIIGVAAGAPLSQVSEKWQTPFKQDEIEKIFYLGDEVLLEKHRGQHLGSKLFDAFVRAVPASFSKIAFAKIEESIEPPLNAAIRNRGFVERLDKSVIIPWNEFGRKEEVPHKLVFWTKDLP